ncbi:ATP-dependent DNA ligase [Microbacterium sp. UMB0228]|uniref:DUF7882 family protein n=1 Tax=Microbacterium sp. UMB0228 TaxID=2029109 RepID=UPI0035B570CD
MGTVGRFIYEGDQKIDIDDRALAHIQLVITTKLRRGEPFGFTWKQDASVGGGRTTVWIHPGSNLIFKYSQGRQPAVSRAWVDALAFTANSPTGLYLVPEPAAGKQLDPSTGAAEVS